MSTVIENDLIRVGQLGTLFTASMKKEDPPDSGTEVALDLTGNTSVQLEFENTLGIRTIVTGSVSGAPTLGVIIFTDTAGISSTLKGSWRVRGIATFSATSKFLGSWKSFEVGD